MEYILERGDKGAHRLELLARAMGPSTREFFQRAGIENGMRCLDVGCGVGVVSCELARLTGHCLGLDIDPEFVEIARRRAQEQELPQARFEVASVDRMMLEEEPFDVVYARYLLSHLSDPESALRSMVQMVKPGGLVMVEDIDFPGHFHHPPSTAFERYLELYQAVVARKGGNARLGRELLSLARSAGLEEVSIHLVVSVHHQGPGKEVAEITLAHISRALLDAGLVEAEELGSLLRELEEYRRDPLTQISIAPTFQMMGTKA